jgi:hypothetical protein
VGVRVPPPALERLLRDLVDGARAALGDDFVGAYLVGSFALGGADEFSDVDFVVVTERVPGAGTVERLQALHALIHAYGSWAEHLEGSYIPKASLRWPEPGERYPYLDNGASRLVWEDHGNTAAERWTLREHGLTLAGPDATTLLGPVPAEALRDEARRRVRDYVAWAHDDETMRRWKQSYVVVTLCRLLYTIETGTVAPKPVAVEWALDRLGPEWADVVGAVREDRNDRWLRSDEPVDPETVARTLAFADYAEAACS